MVCRCARAAVGVVAPVGVAIQVTWLSCLVGGFSGALHGCHLCRSGCGCGVVKSERAASPSSAPVDSGSSICVARWLGVLYLIMG